MLRPVLIFLAAASSASWMIAADWQGRLRLDLQRPVDARLAKIDSGAFNHGPSHLVHDASEVRALSGKLKPGEQLILAGAEWKDARFSFEAHGTMDAPIIVRPEKAGDATFTGASEIAFHGEHLIVTELTLRKVNPAANHAVLFRLGDGEKKPATNCIVNGVTFDHCGSVNAEDWPKVHLWLMNVRGSDNTIANCLFDEFKNIGQMLGAADLPKNGLQRLHILNNRFRDRPLIDNQNGYEIIQIGWSGERASPSGSLIEGNVFERCDGENEIVSLKASDVVVRKNEFLESQGVLSLRSANRVLVEGNLFDGKSRDNTGGITAEGSDHVIKNNLFRSLKKPRNFYFWSLAFLAASAENYGDNGDVAGYGRPRNILVTGNRFEQCDSRIAAGCYLRKEFPLLPGNILVKDNAFTGGKAAGAFDFVAKDPSGGLSRELHEIGNTFEP